MILRDISLRDLRKIEQIHLENSQFPFPDLNSPLYFAQKIIEGDNGIIGAAMLKLTSEAILISDHRIGKMERARALIFATNEMREVLKAKGLAETVVYLTSPNVQESANFFVKRLGYLRVPGEALCLQV